MRAGALAGLLALLVAAPARAADLRPCPDSPTTRCGTIIVPAVRSDPSAGTMCIPFRRYPALGGPARRTLLAIEGGPRVPDGRLGATASRCSGRRGARPVTLRLRRARVCRDVAVSGKVVWQRTSGRVRAMLAYGAAHVRLTWSLATLQRARMHGHVAPSRSAPCALRVTLAAP